MWCLHVHVHYMCMYIFYPGLPWWLSNIESICNARVAGAAGLIPGLGRSPGGGHSNPLQYSRLVSHGQRSLVGYSPKGQKESDITEQLATPTLSLI